MQALLQQLQQQLTPAFCTSLQQVIIAAQWLFSLWGVIVQQQHQQRRLELVPKIACAALPLLQITQRCSHLFNRSAASPGSRAARAARLPYRELWVWQSTAGQLLFHVTQLANNASTRSMLVQRTTSGTCCVMHQRQRCCCSC
jgi:hypothetical protein